MKEIQLTKERTAIIDDEDFELVSRFHWQYFSNHGRSEYARCSVTQENGKQKNILMHRMILDAQPGQLTDHKNHNGLDNRRDNIRISTRSQNQSNRIKKAEASSKYKGVSYAGDHKKWRSYIYFNNKTYFLGYFSDELMAAESYNNAAIEFFGDFAYLNPIERS